MPLSQSLRERSSTARASRTIPRWSSGSPSGTRCSATRRRRCGRCATPARLLSSPRMTLTEPSSGRWLCKPLRGGGGIRVRDWRGGALPAGTFLQEYVEGLACSAAAVGDGRDAVVLGTHRAADREVRGPRLSLVREPRARRCPRDCSSRRARSARGWRGRIRAARAVRRRLHLGRRARVDARGQPAPDRIAGGDRGGATASTSSTRTCTAVRASCLRVRATRAGTARQGGPVRHRGCRRRRAARRARRPASR